MKTSTAQLNVVGKRHFGKKALPSGGGGGHGGSRELFDTLLLWKPKVELNAKGEAEVEIPTNDSLTKFRVAVVATSGEDLFGEGETSFTTTRDLQLISGLPQILREGDEIAFHSTIRNTTSKSLSVKLSLDVKPESGGGPAAAPIAMKAQTVILKPNSSQDLLWSLKVPLQTSRLKFVSRAVAAEGPEDGTTLTVNVLPPKIPHVIQATLMQVGGPVAGRNPLKLPIEEPSGIVAGSATLRVSLAPSLAASTNSVVEAMRVYPFSCLEQRTSKAIVLEDQAAWQAISRELPSYMDQNGLLKYWPMMDEGSDVLTAYILDVTQEAGYKIPEALLARMTSALERFVGGQLTLRYQGNLDTRDIQMRKLTAIEALSRYVKEQPALLSSIQITPGSWATGTVLDWWAILRRWPKLPDGASRLKEAEGVVRARLDFRGTKMGFATEGADYFSWLMSSPDENAAKVLLLAIGDPAWSGDLPRVVRGALDRRSNGVWYNTTANTWGVLAMRKFALAYEKAPVTGLTQVSFDHASQAVNWQKQPKGASIPFALAGDKKELRITEQGSGAPWVTVAIEAASLLKVPVGNGISVTRDLVPVQQKSKGVWSRGDIARVQIRFETQSDFTWIVVRDPVPAGAQILGSGLGHDSKLLTKRHHQRWQDQATFVERASDSYRAYYEYVSKGVTKLDYTIRFNQSGIFQLPNSHLEAMYAPDVYADAPVPSVEVHE